MSDEAPRIASYQADPASVGRVLLLYSGGLDTSVMVRWIQERYGAEIVTLTVDLGGSFTATYLIESGYATEMKFFSNKREALEATGLRE